MDRLDYYDILPSGMDAYLSNYGHHISKRMYEWAVSMMKDRNGNGTRALTKDEICDTLKRNGVEVKRNRSYDVPYVYMMASMDYLGSSIRDEASLCLYVKDYLDDIDGSPSRAFDELHINLVAKGIPIDWEDML